MKRALMNALMILVCFLLQTSVFEHIRLAGVRPNILIILVASIAVMRGQNEGMLIGFFSGLLIDMFFGSYYGIFAFIYMFSGFCCGFFNRIYYEEDLVLPLILIGVNDLAFGLLMYIKQGLLHNHRQFFFFFRTIILPEIVYTVAVGILLYRIILKVHVWMDRREDRNADIV